MAHSMSKFSRRTTAWPRWAKPPHAELGLYPNLLAHHERVGARPAVQEALKFEGLLGK